MKIITRENIPCWYELSWNGQCRAITLRVHKQFAQSVQEIKDTSPIVESLMDQFGFTVFGGNLCGSFGFDDSLVFIGEIEDFLVHRIFIPKIKIPTLRCCKYCEGSGRRTDFPREKCPSCRGNGREYKNNWKEIYAISATLTLFSMLSRFPEVETSCQLPQLFTFQTVTLRDSHGGSITGEFSVPLCRWFTGFPDHASIPSVVKTMMETYKKMVGVTDYEKHSFRASMLSGAGRFSMDCPGDACGIHPDSSDIWEGYQYTCHNVDTALQQITLLAGLSALHDIARREIKKY